MSPLVQMHSCLEASSVSAPRLDVSQASTAIHFAAFAGHAEVCRRLAAAGADDEMPNIYSLSANALAFSAGHTSVRRALHPSASDKDVTEAASRGTPLLLAASNGDMEGVEAALALNPGV